MKEAVSRIFSATNLINGKQIEKGILILKSVGDDELDEQDVALKYVYLGIAYRKKGDLDQSNFYFKRAIDYGHSTGFAYEKLAINLTKQGKLYEAIEVCKTLIDHPRIPAPRSYLTKEMMQKRMEKLEATLARKAKK